MGNPKISRWIVENIPSKRVKRCIQIVDHLDNVTKDILARKKAVLESGDEALLEHVDQGKDLMSVLREFSSQGYRVVRLSFATNYSKSEYSSSGRRQNVRCRIFGSYVVHLQACVQHSSPESYSLLFSSLMFAAMDTTSGALSRILHILAQHPDAQEKLRQEIIEAHHEDGDIDYDQLVALPYLEAVCRETLRLCVPPGCCWSYCTQCCAGMLPLSLWKECEYLSDILIAYSL